MTHSEPLVPGTLMATMLVVVSFVILLITVVGGLYGLYQLMAWALG